MSPLSLVLLWLQFCSTSVFCNCKSFFKNLTFPFVLQVPFLELHGESTEYVGRAEDAIIALSNYRLHIKFKESVVNVSAFILQKKWSCLWLYQVSLLQEQEL